MEAPTDMGGNLKEEGPFGDEKSKRVSPWKAKKRHWNMKLFRIHLLGHCIICLRPTVTREEEEAPTEDVELLEQVPTAELSSGLSSNLLTTLNRLWPYLTTGNKEGSQQEERMKPKKCMTRFSRLPRVCLFCAEKLKAVDKLWRELSVQIEVLRSALIESKRDGLYSWRAENFEKAMMNSELEAESIQAVLEFLQIIDVAPAFVAEAEPGGAEDEETELTEPPEGNPEDDEFYSCMESPTTEYLSPSSWSYDNVSDSISNHSTSEVNRQHQQVVPVKPFSPAPVKRLSRQNSLEIATMCQSSRPPIWQQSSDIFTSRETDMSFDAGEGDEEEGELADDESDPEYVKLEYDGLSSSDYDSSDEDESIAASSVGESVVAYQNLDINYDSNRFNFNAYYRSSGSCGDLEGKG